MIYLKKLLTFIGLLIFGYSFAWGITGHRIVAEIAKNHLSKKARKEIKKLFGNEDIVYWVNWPDNIKSDSTNQWKESFVWHYINVEPQNNFNDFKKAVENQKQPNAFNEIPKLIEQLKNKKNSIHDRKIAFIFLMHIMGDLAQPMHTGRANDLGGNKVELKYFGSKTNLHSIWDGKLIDSQKYNYTEYAKILDIKSKKEIKNIQKGSLINWLYDSHKIANKIYNSVPEDGNVGYEYQYKFNPILERQLLYGGLRLAKVINDIFK